MKRLALISLPVLLALAPLAAGASAPALRLKDYRALVNIRSPRFSPGGHRLAFLTVRSDFVHNRYDATLRVMDTDGSHARALVRGMRDLNTPRWSPDGRTLAFLAKVGRKTQIYLVPAAGGTPEQLTEAANGVEQFAWSPDGQAVAYVTPDPSPISAKDRRAHHDLFAFHDDDYLTTRPPVPSHLWVLTVKTGRARQLTFGPTSVLETAPPIGPLSGRLSSPSWSADGRLIAYTQQADADDSDSDRTRVAVVDVATGREQLVGGHLSYEYMPRFGPRGDVLAYLYPHGPGPLSDMDLFLGAPAGASPHDISAGLDRNLSADFAWLPGGEGVAVLADDHIASRLYVQPPQGRGRALKLGDLNPLDVAASSRGALAFVADTSTQAPELYLLRTPESRPKALTRVNRGFDAYAGARSVEVKWRAPDGQANDGILTYPIGYRAGRRYPMVVFSHGGPEASSLGHFDVYEVGPLRALFAAQGFLVFEPNYRGSDNLGNAHEHAIFGDPGNGPDSDVISGIRMLERRGIVDTSRIAAVGHSYGGYMTAWLISHQHFWRCAVVADGVVDWTAEYELSGSGNLAWTRDSLGGSPWDPKSAALYRSGSPITYAGRITTPTLILSGTDDVTVPLTESLELYHALASRNVPVKFLGIPGAHHSPQDPVHRELFFRAIDRWVVSYLGASEGAGAG